MLGLDKRMVAGALVGGLAALVAPCADIAAATRSYTFNAADQLVDVTEGSTVIASYGVDGDGERITGSTAAGDIIYIRGPEGSVLAEYDGTTGTVVAEYVYVNGRRAVRIAGDGSRTYYHDDLVGTPVAITDGAGSTVWQGETLPFGSEFDATGDRHDRYTFAGHEYDAETRLFWMHARSYDAEIGRFVGPDPAPGDPAAPQSWNRYAYVGNNPLRYTDPDGRYKEDVHRYLTRYLALAAGHPVDTADKLALYNQRVDDWTPAFLLATFDLHFMTTDQAVTLFSVLPETLKGAALHSVQDSYAHEGYGPPLGHLVDTARGKDPDDTSRDVQKALQMALHTFALLGGDPEDFDREFLSEVFAIPDDKQREKMFQRKGNLIVERTTVGVDLRSQRR